MARTGNNPKRRIADQGQFSAEALQGFAHSLVYVGSAIHKRFPGNYGLQPPVNPRPWKSLCDKRRTILLGEARRLLRAGILKGMISTYFEGDAPKYVWTVDDEGEPFEAKIGLGGYHGYMLEQDDDMAAIVLQTWAQR